jgi:hypothetical protein
VADSLGAAFLVDAVVSATRPLADLIERMISTEISFNLSDFAHGRTSLFLNAMIAESVHQCGVFFCCQATLFSWDGMVNAYSLTGKKPTTFLAAWCDL